MDVNEKLLMEITDFLQYMDLLSEEGYEKSEANPENLEVRVGKESIRIPVSQSPSMQFMRLYTLLGERYLFEVLL